MNVFKKLRARNFSSQKMTHACKVIFKIVNANNATFGVLRFVCPCTFHKIGGLRFAFTATMVNCKIWRTASQKMYALKLHFRLVQFWKLLIRHKSHFDKRKFVHEVCAFRIKICVDNIFFYKWDFIAIKIVSSLLLSKLNVVHMVVDPNQVPTSKWFRFSPFWSIF